MILNLKFFNQYVEYYYFKLDIIWIVVYKMILGCFMVFIDLKDVYYFVYIDDLYQKYLIVLWKGNFY